MNRDIFLQMLLHAPDLLTLENLCLAYPHLVPADDSPYWLKLMQDRFPEKTSVNLRKIYSDLVDYVNVALQRLEKTNDSLMINLTTATKIPDIAEFLSRHPEFGSEDYLCICRYENLFYLSIFQEETLREHVGIIDRDLLKEFLQMIPSYLLEWR